MTWKRLWRKPEPQVAIEVPVLCKFWKEDGVWNASAVDLPIVVFGDTYEQAQQAMADGIVAHLRALQRAGQLDETVATLRSISRTRSVRIEEMDSSLSLTKIGAAIRDDQVLALV